MLIQTAEDYEAALRRFDTLFPAIMGSPTANELDALAAQIEAYEHRLLKAVLPPPRSVWLYCPQCGEGDWHDPIPGDESPEGKRCEACLLGIMRSSIDWKWGSHDRP